MLAYGSCNKCCLIQGWRLHRDLLPTSKYPTKRTRSSKGEYRGNKDIGYGYARVHVYCEDNAAEFSVSVEFDDDSWNEQLRDGSFRDWKDAAITGCQYAASVGQINNGKWIIHRIVGLLVDTTPEYVAIAGGRAIWTASRYEFNPDDDCNLTDYAKQAFPNGFN